MGAGDVGFATGRATGVLGEETGTEVAGAACCATGVGAARVDRDLGGVVTR